MLLSEIGGKTTANLLEIGGKISEICRKSEASAPPNFGEMAKIAVLNFREMAKIGILNFGEMAKIAVLNFGEMEFFSVNT